MVLAQEIQKNQEGVFVWRDGSCSEPGLSSAEKYPEGVLLAAPGGLLPLVGHVPDRHRRHAELLGDHPNAAGPAGTA
jgi:hypothetical protein